MVVSGIVTSVESVPQKKIRNCCFRRWNRWKDPVIFWIRTTTAGGSVRFLFRCGILSAGSWVRWPCSGWRMIFRNRIFPNISNPWNRHRTHFSSKAEHRIHDGQKRYKTLGKTTSSKYPRPKTLFYVGFENNLIDGNLSKEISKYVLSVSKPNVLYTTKKIKNLLLRYIFSFIIYLS